MSTIVIGAGLAGLSAARRLHKRGEDVVVVEAQPYVGGRIRTVRDRLRYGQPADLGGSFIDIGQDRILRACADFGVRLTPAMRLFPEDPDGRFTAASPLRNATVADGRLLTDMERDKVADEVRCALDTTPPDPAEMIPAWAARAGLSPLAYELLCAQAGFNPVQDAAQVQMSLLEAPHVGKVCWMMSDGTDSLTSAMARGIDVRLEQPVRLVCQQDEGLTVETDYDRFAADDVIVATPVTPTLQIGFDPVLPEWKIHALLATPMSQGGKVAGQYANGAELIKRIGSGVVSNGPVSLTWARPLGPDDTVVLLGLIPDRSDGVLRDEEQALEALDHVVRLATGLKPERLAGILQDWTSEEYAGGVVSTLHGDFPRLPSVLAQPVGALHFAGEHATDMWAGAMDGALRSGERAADEVLQRRGVRSGV